MIKLVKYVLKFIGDGFYFLCSTISKGFFYYFYAICSLIEKIFKFLMSFFKKLQMNPFASFIVMFVFLFSVFSYTFLYSSNENVAKVKLKDIEQDIHLSYNDSWEQSNSSNENDANESNHSNIVADLETNLFRRFSKTSLDEINIDELKNVNSDVVSWLIVDNTNINYPIVQTTNNDYYLNHNFNKSADSNGWTFMEYRNHSNMSDDNTIFYGHNLLNKTSFGSISNLFTDKWFNDSNHTIVVVTNNARYVYQIFSVYYSEPVTDYLQTNFLNKDHYLDFLNDLKEKSVFDFNVDLDENDKIITLSTCTDDNTGRKVVHAKLLN